MGATRFEGRWIGRCRAAGEGTRALLAPSPGGASLDAAQIADRLAAGGMDAITLVDPPPDFAVALRQLTPAQVQVAGVDELGAGGPIALCPEGAVLLVGPGAGVVRAVGGAETPSAPSGAAAERLLLIDLLIGGRGRAPTQEHPVLDHPPLSLCLEASRRINRHVLRFLVHAGGAELRTVLRDGERIRGRIWTAALKGGFALRYGQATTRLWTRWSRRALATASVKVRRRYLRAWLPGRDADTGDWIVFALVHAHLPAVGWPAEYATLLARRCRQISPLACLSALRTAEIDDLQAHLAQLLAPHAVRIVECIDTWLIERWLSALKALVRPTVEAHQIEAAAQVVTAWYAALDAHGRLDLARASLRATVAWLAEVDPGAVRASLSRRADRQAVRGALATLADALARPDALRLALAEERYGDARYPEAQLFLADHAEHFVGAAAALDHLARVMRGVIG